MTQLVIDDKELKEMIGNITAKLRDSRSLMMGIGEMLTESTKQRFADSRAPNGAPWAPNSPVTLERYLKGSKSNFTKTGKLSAKGRRVGGGKKPLIGTTKTLSTTIHYVLVGSDSVAVGSNAIYSGTQQFGAKRGELGQTSRGGPIPWGDIPARPFLGISDEDEAAIIDLVREHVIPKKGKGQKTPPSDLV